MPRLYSNNFSTTLVSAINAIDTSFDVVSAAGLPALGAGDYFHLTIDDGSFIEIVRVDAVVGNTLSVQRGQESTVQRVFASGSTVELRVTAGSFGAQSVPVAADITYDNAVSGLTATELQSAIDELAASGGGAAADIAYDNTLSGLIATQVQAAIDELAAGGNKLLADPGYVELREGLILQFGTGVANGSATTPINFPIAFPTAAIAAFAHLRQISSAVIFNTPANLTTTSVTFDHNLTGDVDIYWLALGY